MGLKLSCIHRGCCSISRQQVHQQPSPAPARVIAGDGSLKEFPAASPLIAVSDELGLDDGGGDTSSFVCSADVLYFNEHPPAMSSGDVLLPGQMYFVLPGDLLGRPLSAADMAALAARASSALASSSASTALAASRQRRHGRRRRACGGGKKKAVRVMPVREEMEDGGEDVFFNEKLNQQTLGEFGMVSRSPSPQKMEEKLAAAATAATTTSRMKRALSIIQEDAE
ncbi:hypothetical protein HU200_040505 [Digitaria exilis]|uniref:Uncharacterized protein n=1 Tax=Digitaria exilis TaxID=1010633 RepID=A0A835EK25_9POAL|nr:hypothetical protein HU200_040505 [Digitaria exilis]